MKKIMTISSLLFVLLMTLLPANVSQAKRNDNKVVQLTGLSLIFENGEKVEATGDGNHFHLDVIGIRGDLKIQRIELSSPNAVAVSAFLRGTSKYTEDTNLEFENGVAVIDYQKLARWAERVGVSDVFPVQEDRDYLFTMEEFRELLPLFGKLTGYYYYSYKDESPYYFNGYLVDNDGNECPSSISIEAYGWKKENNKWYFYDKKGERVSGWVTDKGHWYYMGKDLTMLTGWFNDRGTWYYFDKHGLMQTYWSLINNKWYFFNRNGAMGAGWVKTEQYGSSNEVWYYFDPTSGVMKKGWVLSGGKWYYLDASGIMKMGWIQISNKWYYLDVHGAMKTGWVQVKNNWFYLYSDGHLAVSTKIGPYKVNEYGVWIH